MTWNWKAWNIVLTCLGLVIIIFSLIWLLVIFPPMVKLPADHHKVVNFEGTYKATNLKTHSLDEFSVNLKREQQATEVRDNVLIIHQTITTTPAAGIDLSDYGLAPVQTEELGVDRTRREYVPGYGDMDRSGQFSFPERVGQKPYSLWIPAAGRPLEAQFIGEEDFHGVKVFTFKISVSDLDIGTQPVTNLDQVLDIVCNLKVEPVSGTTVSSESDLTISVVPAPGMKMTVYASSLTFTDDTITDLVDTAKSARTALLWARVYGFWLGIGVGIVLTLVGVLGTIQTKPKA